MQTKFALLTLHNAEANQRAKILVGYLAKKWSAVRLESASARAAYLTLRDSGERDQRISDIRYGFGTVSNADKPMTEIAMLIKRHVVLLSGAHAFDNPMDWRVEEKRELPWQHIFNEALFTKTTVHALLQRLWGSRDGYRLRRVDDVLRNVYLLREGAEPESYHGLLSCMPGAMWKGMRYSGLGGLNLHTRFHALKRLGALIGQCISKSRLGENFEGLYNELLMSLRHPEMHAHVQFSVEGILNGVQRIHNCTITRASYCGHLDEGMSMRAVGPPRTRRVICSTCYNNNTVPIADMNNERWCTDMAFWSSNHRAYYSYDIDSEENGVDERLGNRAIMDYTTNVLKVLKRDPKMSSSHYGDFLMGLELEMTSGSVDQNTAARDVRRRLGNSYCIIKYDGSLPPGGFEVVTAPRGLKEHIEAFSAWEIDPAYRAWDTGACGLHVHLHSRAFTEMTLGKFIMFFNIDTNAQFIRRIAGRHPLRDTQAQRYCGLENQEMLDSPKKAVKNKTPERYRIINTTNLSRAEAERLGIHTVTSGKYDTVEVRIFKASLKKERLLAQIEFAHAAVMFCRVASYRDLTGATFLKWLAPNSKLYPHLADWFGARRSKATKDAGGKALEEVCVDQSRETFVVPARPPRAAPRRTGSARPVRGRAESVAAFTARLAAHNEAHGTRFQLTAEDIQF